MLHSIRGFQTVTADQRGSTKDVAGVLAKHIIT